MPQRVMAPPVAGQQHLEQGMQQGPGGQNAIFGKFVACVETN